jgi:hypothetical protein
MNSSCFNEKFYFGFTLFHPILLARLIHRLSLLEVRRQRFITVHFVVLF